uniref:Uncharacterized protein n=1 Tax=Rhizophora mucronata TaxID=61149 RepID=A0A2P2JE59_RHIMU
MASFPTSSTRNMSLGGRKLGFCKDLKTEIEKDEGLQRIFLVIISFDHTGDFEVTRE